MSGGITGGVTGRGRAVDRLAGAAVAGALLTFGVTPLAATAPPARADVLDGVIDQIFAPSLDAATSGPAPDAAAEGLQGLPGLFEQFVYAPLHTAMQDWIHSTIGGQIDDVVNKLTGSLAIGNGTAGTETHPDGGAGGWLFGDGGEGWNSTVAGQAGGDGGAAGLFGTGGEGGGGGAGAAGGDGGAGGSLLGVGGAGGNGGDGATGGAGGAGGDGGDGRGVFGSGGHGGNAGDSSATGDLPALGGAGGNAGPLGAHGAVGHFGTVDGAAPTGSSDLTATGEWFTNSTGQVVMQHGVNIVDKTPPFLPEVSGFTDADAAQLAAHGINEVRLGVQWEAVEPQPGVYDDTYLAGLAQTVQLLSDHGIRVLLDMHQDEYGNIVDDRGDGAPAWATDTGGLPYPDRGFPLNYTTGAVSHAFDTFWANGTVSGVRLENAYSQMWQHVADYFKDDPDVVGYEIMNEPWPGSSWLATLLGDPHFDAQELTPFYNQVDAAIRSVDPATPVYFEPNVLFGNLPVNTHLGTVDDPNSVFAFHPYCLTNDFLDPGSSFGCGAYEALIDGWAEHYTKAHDIPGMITEFGNTDVGAVTTIAMNAANQHHFGWLFWPVGLFANTGNLETLAQPYPETVSGTPDTWTFENGTFNLSYSTAMADGHGSFPAGAQTEISVPASEYPNGYQVSVTGGHVVSAANAPTLVIASDAGASTVQVTVKG